MSNILTAAVSIKGIRPLAQHLFGPDAIPLEKQEKTGVAWNDPEEWRHTAMITRDGQLFLKPTYVFACLRDGGKYTKKGRSGTLLKWVVATLQVTDDLILLDRFFPGFPNGRAFDINVEPAPTTDITAPVYLDICMVKNPATGARNVRYRICASTGWKTTFHIMWDKTIVSRGEMEAVTIDAGRLVGLADGRSVGYGRFQVESFDVQE